MRIAVLALAEESKQEKERAEFMKAASEMYEEVRQWRGQHPGASIDEIAEQITPKRRALMGQLMLQMACQAGDGEALEGISCAGCGVSVFGR